jgi:hypothetical protein
MVEPDLMCDFSVALILPVDGFPFSLTATKTLFEDVYDDDHINQVLRVPFSAFTQDRGAGQCR